MSITDVSIKNPVFAWMMMACVMLFRFEKGLLTILAVSTAAGLLIKTGEALL